MPRYKTLRSVAHNFGHSFTSLMNYAGDDYVMGHILRLARRTGRDTMTIDLVKREAGPSELLAEPVSGAVARYVEWFWDLIQKHGSDRSFVQSASLILRFEIATERPVRNAPQLTESSFTCEVRVTDSRGKEYSAHFEGWWYPERLEESRGESNHWRKLWSWFRAQPALLAERLLRRPLRSL